MKKRISNAALRKAAAQTTKAEILEATTLTCEEYKTMQYHVGRSFLSVVVKEKEIIKLLEGSKMFWGWWRNQWHLRDEQFLSEQKLSGLEVNSCGQLQTRDEYTGNDYGYYHNLHHLTSSFHPFGVRLQSSFAHMIGLVIKNEVKP
ncbi:hypothetical protein [Pinibacter soli]|uniref:Uncharacterized protein n=1 Tax=Pinibacter soli TaxID=3044211 RepID=A0ABT6R9S7_9BACT|nr:hypothetical protein [Pinibacter soli]MDI3319155.1 hypothetical protein [Pinibacter soli]